jgi:hypothetical protein
MEPGMTLYKYFLISMISYFLLASCEEPYVPPISDDVGQYVVEGYIEAGEDPLPTFVILTRSLPFITELNPEIVGEIFVNDATVQVNDGSKTVDFTNICLSQLPPEIADQISNAIGLQPTFGDLCIYLDLNDELDRRVGGRYDLEINHEGNILTSTTTIPEPVPILEFRFDPPPDRTNDTMAQLVVTIQDPPDQIDFYRYATGVFPGPVTPGFATVTDDFFFDGQRIDFPLQATQRPGEEEFDPDTFGLFNRGDSIAVKWSTLDMDHFEFWNTLEFNNNNQGPFASYTRVSTNIQGGLGIWGGYAVDYLRTRVPE